MIRNQPSSRIDNIGLALLKKALSVGTLVVSILLFCAFLYLGQKYKMPVANVAGALVFLVGLAIAFFSVPSVIERMREDKALLLSDAIGHTFYSYLAMASFLPVVGPLFERLVVKKKNPFTQEDE